MHATKRMILTAGFLLAAAVASWSFAPFPTHDPVSPLTPGAQVLQQFDSSGNSWLYLMYVPPNYNSEPNRKWPIIINFPVMGACYDGMWGWGGFVTNSYGPTKYLINPSTCKFISDSFIVMTPWMTSVANPCRTATADNAFFNSFYAPLITHVLKSSVRLDIQRVNVMGYCWGAGVLYKYFSQSATLAKIPASMSLWSPGDPQGACVDEANTTKACLFGSTNNIGIRFYHNKPDTYSPWQVSQTLSDNIKACGNTKVIFSLSPTGPHESWNGTDQDPALYTWMLAQRQLNSPFGQTEVIAPQEFKAGAISNKLVQNAMGSGEAVDIKGRVIRNEKAATLMAKGIYFVRSTNGNSSVAHIQVSE